MNREQMLRMIEEQKAKNQSLRDCQSDALSEALKALNTTREQMQELQKTNALAFSNMCSRIAKKIDVEARVVRSFFDNQKKSDSDVIYQTQRAKDSVIVGETVSFGTYFDVSQILKLLEKSGGGGRGSGDPSPDDGYDFDPEPPTC